MNDLINRKAIKDMDLLVICPTRERPERLQTFMESFNENILLGCTGIIYCVDDNDPQLVEYQKIFGSEHCYHIGTGRRTITMKMNQVVNDLCPGYKYYGYLSDDNIIKTQYFDTKMIEAIKDGGGWGMAYGNDLFQGEKLPTHIFASGNLVKALGWLYLPSVRHLYGDNAWKVLGEGIHRLHYLKDVTIEHVHPMAKKAEWDESYKYTNSPAIYEGDKKAFHKWVKTNAKYDIERVVRAIHAEAGFKASVALCMIVKDTEPPPNLNQCIRSVAGWVDELNIVFNYKMFPAPWRLKHLLEAVPKGTTSTIPAVTYPSFAYQYLKWTDFSDMRNRSLDMAHAAYCIYLDCDDVVDRPWHIKDSIFRNPEADYFQCKVLSFKENMNKEIILHPRLFRNKLAYRFRNYCHEDIMLAIKKEIGHKRAVSPIEVYHTGNINRENARQKNLRNLVLIEKQMKDDPHTLVYFGYINALILSGTRANLKKAIQAADECLKRYNMTDDDPLTPKIWINRAGACMLYYNQTKDTASFLGSKQGFAKAWDTWKHPEAGVNLAELLMIENNWDQAIAIMDVIMSTEEFLIPSVPFDWDEVVKKCYLQLGDCHYMKKEWEKARGNYEQFLMLFPNHLQAADRLCDILRKLNHPDEAALLTMKMINVHPGYAVGWKNMARDELIMKRYRTARLFLAEVIKIDPKDEEARHNLKQIDRMLFLLKNRKGRAR